MRRWQQSSYAVAFAISCWLNVASASNARHLDGLQRVAKQPQTTAGPVLKGRDEDGVCEVGLKLCPPSLNGGCCPDKYDCAKDSCVAQDEEPSTCRGKVGWFACDAVHGGGCCPDGYQCERGSGCVPPAGSAYDFDCPTSQYLCPEEFNYGCCPNHMGCGKNQCYSTEPVTYTTTMDVTTTRNGDETVYITTATTVTTPTQPTAFPTVGASDQHGDQAVFKFYPPVVAKVSATVVPDDSGDNGGGGLTSAELGGIIAGAIIFLILVVVGAYIIIRHLNKVVAAVSNSNMSRQSDISKTRPPMHEYRPTDSEIDALSVDPLMMSPPPSHARHDSTTPDALLQFGKGSPDLSSNPTPDSFAGGYQPLSPGRSRHTSVDTAGNPIDYFEVAGSNRSYRVSQVSGTTPPYNRVSADSQQTATYMHARHWSNASENSEEGYNGGGVQAAARELEGTPYIPELVGSPTGQTFPATDEPRRTSASSGVSGMVRPPLSHQRRRSEARSSSGSGMAGMGSSSTPNILGVLSEEIHGFHGPSDRMAGQTAHRPRTRDLNAEMQDHDFGDLPQR